nr:OTU domain-containing protein At3g57810-like [Tanacetum cinerariifolium]
MLPLPYPPPPSLLPTATTCQSDSSPFIVNWDVQVVDEIHKRRKEIEWWFIEGDLDLYVKRIEKTYVWGGEPELLMASHILKTKLKNLVSGNFHVGEKKLLNIATYGKEYEQYEKISIKVPFYGYGHYENIELRLPVPLSPNDFMDNASDESDEGDAHEDATDLGDEKVGLYLFRLVSKILSLNVVF